MPNQDLDALLAELDRLHEAATNAPWQQYPFTQAGAVWISFCGEPIVEPAGPPDRDEEQGKRGWWKLFRPWGVGHHRDGAKWWKQTEANAELIVALRNGYPQIRAALTCQRRKLDEPRAECGRAQCDLRRARGKLAAALSRVADLERVLDRIGTCDLCRKCAAEARGALAGKEHDNG